MRANEFLAVLIQLLGHLLRILIFGIGTGVLLFHLVNTWWQLIQIILLIILFLGPNLEIRPVLKIMLLNVIGIVALLPKVIIRNLSFIPVTTSEVRLPVRNILLGRHHILKSV
jgi:hypothetical protein